MGKLPLILITLALSTIAAEAHAQSWLGEPGDLNVSFGTSYGASDKVLEDMGSPANGNFYASHLAFTLGVDYVTPHDKLSVSASLPLMALKADIQRSDGMGAFHRADLAVNDDGDYHFEAQDFKLLANYELLGRDTFAFFGHLGASVPATDYPTVGDAAAGRGLKSAILGLSGLVLSDEWVPGLYATASYEFRYTENADDEPELEKFNQDHSAADVVVGYYVTDDIEVNIGGNVVIYHGGFHFADWDQESVVVQDYHDKVINERAFLAGAGASYAITDRMGVNAYFRIFLDGQNTANASVGGLGLTWAAL